MVAYSFKSRFVIPILVGLGDITPGDGVFNVRGFQISTFCRKNLPLPKRQTIRANGKRRHARPGEAIQLYTGMRTKQCRKIGESKCESVHKIEMDISWHALYIEVDGRAVKGGGIHDFARQDGFANGEDMLQFWQEEHRGVSHFDGSLIKW